MGGEEAAHAVDGVGIMTEDELNTMRVIDLRAMLKDRELSTAGRKADLVARLLESGILSEQAGSAGAGDSLLEAENATSIADEDAICAIDKNDDMLENDEDSLPRRSKSPTREPTSDSADNSHMTVESEEKDFIMGGTSNDEDDMGTVEVTSNATKCVRIDNFVRPLMRADVEQLLERYGSVHSLWMDKIKTHAYVQFHEESSAIAARDGIEGFHFQDGGKILTAQLVTEEEFDAALAGKAPRGFSIPTAVKIAQEKVKMLKSPTQVVLPQSPNLPAQSIGLPPSRPSNAKRGLPVRITTAEPKIEWIAVPFKKAQARLRKPHYSMIRSTSPPPRPPQFKRRRTNSMSRR